MKGISVSPCYELGVSSTNPFPLRGTRNVSTLEARTHRFGSLNSPLAALQCSGSGGTVSRGASCNPCGGNSLLGFQGWRRRDSKLRRNVSLSCTNERLRLGVKASANIEKNFNDFKFTVDDWSKNLEWDVVGLGQAMVDFSGAIGNEFLNELGLEKGKRKVVNHEERGKVLQALDGKSYKVSAGGSLSNTLVALARLGSALLPHANHSALEPASQKLLVAMTGSVGNDALGEFYRAKLLRANVHFLSKPIQEGTTGTVVVLTTPDAQRTMLSYQGMSSEVHCDESLENTISKSKFLVVEGYLWEIPQTVEAIAKACKIAKENGIVVALTASDVTCVLRHRTQFWEVTKNSTDVFFANAEEARALAGLPATASPALAAKIIGSICPLVSVTDGPKGAYISLNGEVSYIPPHRCEAVDTCGAGDAFSAGIIFGLLRGIPDVKAMGALASKVASVVVNQQGTRLKEEDAEKIVKQMNFEPMPLFEGPIMKKMLFHRAKLPI